ncbi:cadherin-7-like isoform X1 [Salvelinus fontinalis]|uniref:cadherin-7-like isoform X1 n=2 Tax=Salvelinus fontinalis TaxID=8038 RepID=UPI002485857C|nr:cadherin-7-like isoform X1 [Salvelinus fontinalis]
MTIPTVLLLVLVCMWEEQRGCSSLTVSLPITAQNSQEDLIELRAAEYSLVNHGQNAEVLMTSHIPLTPGLTDKEKNGMDEIVQISTQTPDFTLQTTLTPGKIWNVITSKSDHVDNGDNVHTQSLEAQQSMEAEANGDPKHHVKLQTVSHPESRVLPESISGRGLVSRGAGLTLIGVGPHSRRKRSWQWNQFFVIEEYRGPEPVLIGRLHTDMDRGDGRTKYILEGEGVGSVFVIDGNTGNIHVTKSLDREEKDQYRLIATVTDRQTGHALEPSSMFIIRVQDINDNPPVFQNEPYSTTVPEMANIGTSIIQVTATDADDPTYGNSARLVYAVTQGQRYFSVDPQTGVLRTAVTDMDRESQDTYLVVLEAKDMGGHLGGMSGTTTVTVRLSDVNDNPPHFRKSAWSFSISELAAPGVEVGRLSATDADLGENAMLEYTILDGEEGDTFNITGRDQEAVIVLNKLLDYERCGSYSFSVEVMNPVVDARFLRKGPFKDRATVRVMVLNADEPPRFSRSRYRLDVPENCPPVCSVGRVSAVDPDTGQSSNIRYSIDPQSDPEALFRIASDSGLITTVMELDREREQWHNITVIATQRDNPNLVSRVVVAIETLDQNDNAPELDRQYTTSVCDSSTPGQVVQVLRAVDRDQEGQDATVHFSIPPESSSALNLTIRESGGATARLVLQSALQPLAGFSSSLLTLYVPIVLRDGASGLTNTGTVTVTVCPCLRGGMQAEERGRQRDRGWERQTVCLPLPSASPSLIFSMVTLLALLACVTTLLVVCALSLSLRHQKRDSHSPFEEDDVRENIITYDDEGGGEADTAAFDITALQSMHRVQRMQDSRNIWYTQQNQARARTYSWSRTPHSALDPRHPGSTPVYGHLCYSIHTLPVLRDLPEGRTPFQSGLQLAKLMETYGLPGHQMGNVNNSLVIQNQGSFDLLESGAVHLNPAEPRFPSREGPESMMADSRPTEREGGRETNTDNQQQQLHPDQGPIRTQPESVLTDEALVLTYSVPNGSCSQSHSSSISSSEQQENKTESSPSQTTTTTGASSSAVDDTDTDSSTLPSSEKNEDTVGDTHTKTLGESTYSIVGSLNQGSGGIPVTGTTLYPGSAEFLNMYALGRSLSGGMLGYGRGWGCARGLVSNRAGEKGGANCNPSLPLRMEDFLKHRLDQVTDLSQPPYDSLQTYEFEGGDSRAGSLSSLESEGEREEERGRETVDELDQKFHRLVKIIEEREQEKECERSSVEETTRAEDRSQGLDVNDMSKTESVDEEKEVSRWDF